MLGESYGDSAMNTESSLIHHHTKGRKLLQSLLGFSLEHFTKQRKIKLNTLANFKEHKVL